MVFLPIIEKRRMKLKTLLVIFIILLSFPAHSGPARKSPVYMMQPDGSSFCARIRGDEFMKLYTTEDGNAIIRENDGWWCYAYYDSDGRAFSSGHRVGRKVPPEVTAKSRSIPYGMLSANAAMKRAAAPKEDEPIMRRILRKQGASTKSIDSKPVTKHGIIILAQFRDEKFTHSREDFMAMLNQAGYSRNGATGCAKEYFDAQFNGTYEFGFDVSPVITLPGNMASYGSNLEDGSDKAPAQMIIDACKLADDHVDFSVYDDDGDNVVDNVFVFFAGGDEAEGAGPDRIWSHSWHIYGGAHKDLFLDGKRIDRYACTAELSRRYTTASDYRDVLAGIGTFCHEYFHTFGIPDMYDTDYEGSGGTAAGLWSSTSLMDSGNHNNYGNTPPYLNAVERELLGISEPEILSQNGGYSLEPIHKNGRYFRLDTDYDGEYYLFECRSEEGWDKYAGGSGMLVYHIDKSSRSTGYSDSYGHAATAVERWHIINEVNGRPDHQCADLVEADSRQDSFSEAETESFHTSQKNIRGVFFPGASVNSLLPDSSPGLTYWSGAVSEISVTNIRKTNGGVAFNVLGFTGYETPPYATSIRAEVFMDAAIILFESDREFEGEAKVTWGKTGAEADGMHVAPYEPGKYAVTLEGLQPDNKTYTVRISFELNGLTGEEKSISFMTKKSPAVKWPFIYMNGVGRNNDGTLPKGSGLPLRVYNAEDAAEIIWTYDGAEITTGGSGYFTMEKSGTLEAHIIWKDGSEETIMKEIVIGKEKE